MLLTYYFSTQSHYICKILKHHFLTVNLLKSWNHLQWKLPTKRVC